MPHINMAAMLPQSKGRKKGPGSQLSVASIVVCNVVIIVIILSAVAIHKQKSKGGVDLLEDLRNYDIIWSKTSDTVYGGIKPDRLPKLAIFNTTKGSFTVELFPKHAPKTVLNFVSHSKNGYYDGVIFHRVIKNFMVQSGDPKGDGTGGKSIWGGGFGDEFHEELKHEPFTLSMANLGRPNTNRSQFFITTDVASPHLDNKYTVFGRVTEGREIVMDIERAETDADDRPLDPIVIHNIAVADEL